MAPNLRKWAATLEPVLKTLERDEDLYMFVCNVRITERRTDPFMAKRVYWAGHTLTVEQARGIIAYICEVQGRVIKEIKEIYVDAWTLM